MFQRWTARVIAGIFLSVTLAGCSSPRQSTDTGGGAGGGYAPPPPRQQPGMSTKKKLVLLAGAAALAYLYNKHQQNKGKTGSEGQYYRSKNGRVYYRDANGGVHWVTPPQGGIQVPANDPYLPDPSTYSQFSP